MRILAKGALRDFCERFPDARESLQAWYREAEKADWDTPAKVKEKCRHVSIVGANRVVFHIKGNYYRSVVEINYGYRVVYVRYIGNHADYARINVDEV
jgi:mRNA interferase HigB